MTPIHSYRQATSQNCFKYINKNDAGIQNQGSVLTFTWVTDHLYNP